MRGYDNTPDSFWSMINRTSPDSCWLWQGTVVGSGYGQIRWKGVKVGVHRLAYELTYGPIPDDLIIRHRCDTRLCCNPNHLEIGTYSDNAHDRAIRGRNREQRGEANSNAVLSESDVAYIRESYASGAITQRELAQMLGVSQGQIARIVSGRRW